MTFLELFIAGVAINILLDLMFTITMVVITLTDIGGDPTKIMALKTLENKVNEMKDLRSQLPFIHKYRYQLITFIPFASVLKTFMMIISFKDGGMLGHTDREITEYKAILGKDK